MNNTTEIVLWIVSLILSAFFSGMQIAFVSSDKLRYALDRKTKSPIDYILNVFYTHPRKFLSTLTIGNLLVLIVFVYLSITLSDIFVYQNITNSPYLALFLQYLANALQISLQLLFLNSTITLFTD